jgi:hypothetical protein
MLQLCTKSRLQAYLHYTGARISTRVSIQCLIDVLLSRLKKSSTEYGKKKAEADYM